MIVRITKLLVGLFATLLVAIGAAQPASAHASTSLYWKDFHEMCRYSGCVSSGNLVRLWQSMLYDRGDLPKSGIDGTFGPNTEAATMKWQQDYNNSDRHDGMPLLSVDGWVGPGTWAAAQDQLTLLDDSCGSYVTWEYINQLRFKVRRNCSSGVWTFTDPNNGGAWTNITHG